MDLILLGIFKPKGSAKRGDVCLYTTHDISDDQGGQDSDSSY